MSIQALRESRAEKVTAVRALVEKADWNAANDQPVYDSLIAEIEDLDGKIARHNRMNELAADTALRDGVIDAALRHGRDSGSEACNLFAKWLRGGDNALSAEDWAAHQNAVAHIVNTMSTSTNSEGGFTVQTDVATQLLDALKAFGGMRTVSEVIRTAGGNAMSWPTSDGTAEEGEIVDQNASATDADPSFGTLALPVYKYSSKVVTVPIELLQDSSIDVEAFVRGRLATRLGRITNKHFTTGTGTNQPRGVVTAAAVGVAAATGNATGFTYDHVVDLEHSVDPAYRDNASFMLSDGALRTAKKIKDTAGRPIFLPGYDVATEGRLATLLGYPVTINQDFATPAANAKSMAFGDFSKYVIRDAMAIEVYRFTDSAYAKKGQVGFLAWLRSGGNLMDVGGAVKTFQHSAS